MPIPLSDMITPEKKQLILKIKEVLDDLEPGVQQAVDAGMPFQKHLDVIRERREWNNKFLKLFNLTTN